MYTIIEKYCKIYYILNITKKLECHGWKNKKKEEPTKKNKPRKIRQIRTGHKKEEEPSKKKRITYQLKFYLLIGTTEIN